MPYNREVLYSRDQLIRDIAFLFHVCAGQGTIFGDDNHSPTLLDGSLRNDALDTAPPRA